MQNLVNIFRSVPKHIVRNNANWYIQASKFASHISHKYRISYNKVVGVISALSPACNWPQNKKDAEKLIAAFVAGDNFSDYTYCTYGANVIKGWNILLSKSDPVTFFNAKTGAKTLNFYLNILDPYNPDAVTIDRHAFAVYAGRKTGGTVSLTPKRYGIIAAAYIEASRQLNMVPNQLQAILWAWQTTNFHYIDAK